MISVFAGHLDQFARGLLTTVELTVFCFAGALLLGVLVAAVRVSPVPVLRAVGLAYVETLQNIPLLVWLVLFVFALPEVGVQFPLFQTAALVIALYHAAYVAEAVRSGVNSVSLGQGEAARALGLTFAQSLRHVVLPQALRAVIQPIGNVFIMLTMNTSLVAAVGVMDLTGVANRVILAEAQPILIIVGSGLAYVALTFAGGQLTGFIERKVAIVR